MEKVRMKLLIVKRLQKKQMKTTKKETNKQAEGIGSVH